MRQPSGQWLPHTILASRTLQDDGRAQCEDNDQLVVPHVRPYRHGCWVHYRCSVYLLLAPPPTPLSGLPTYPHRRTYNTSVECGAALLACLYRTDSLTLHLLHRATRYTQHYPAVSPCVSSVLPE